MPGVATLPSPSRARVELRSLAESMQRVREELDKLRSSPHPDHVHDLRVAIRRCRSVATVFEEIDLDPSWLEMRKTAKKLFRTLGVLRDAQVMDDWAKKLAPPSDEVRIHLHDVFATEEPQLREDVLRIAGKFDEKSWKRLERRLGHRVRYVPVGGLAAECLAWERFEEIKDLHAAAMRSSKPKAWHALRIGLKRLRYTVESLLPLHHSAWSENLKRLQDLLGDIHDLDVLREKVKTQTGIATSARKLWKQTVERERNTRVQTYRHLTLGKASIWNKWKHGLPHGERLEAASLARLQVTARASQTRPTRAARTSRIALRVFDLLRRAKAGRVFGDAAMRRVLQGAGLLHALGNEQKPKHPHKESRKILLEMRRAPGWSAEDWDLLAWTVRFHRGAEPKLDDDSAFSKPNAAQQENIRALAGVLRLARVLHKSGVDGATGLKLENSAEATVLLVPGLANSLEIAAKLAAGKHLLETALGKPLFLRGTAKPSNVIALPTPVQETLQSVAIASD